MAVGLIGFLLASCAETQFITHTAKRVSKAREKIEKPAYQEIYKIGNPYQIDGVWYYPTVDYTYDETGIASWYGAKFHGRRTANGGVYDMNDLTAAHRTLPFQTNVRVERLDNGRSVEVRINDRGPFVPGRVIDLSRGAARRLRMHRKGVARVRLTPLSLPYAPRTRWFVLAGPFAEEEAARRLAGRLAGGARARVLRGWGGEADSFRLRLGGLADKAGARALAERMRAEGYGAFLVRGR